MLASEARLISVPQAEQMRLAAEASRDKIYKDWINSGWDDLIKSAASTGKFGASWRLAEKYNVIRNQIKEHFSALGYHDVQISYSIRSGHYYIHINW